eukprot:PhF_6_TR31499/c0_g3_i1/m.46366
MGRAPLFGKKKSNHDELRTKMINGVGRKLKKYQSLALLHLKSLYARKNTNVRRAILVYKNDNKNLVNKLVAGINSTPDKVFLLKEQTLLYPIILPSAHLVPSGVQVEYDWTSKK